MAGRSSQLKIRITPEQKEMLRRLSRRAGQDMSSYVLSRDMLRLFDLLNAELAILVTHGEIYLVGGAVMCLALDARHATRDVDGYFQLIDRAGQGRSRKRGRPHPVLPPDPTLPLPGGRDLECSAARTAARSRDLYRDDSRFRSRVAMARHGFGRGE